MNMNCVDIEAMQNEVAALVPPNSYLKVGVEYVRSKLRRGYDLLIYCSVGDKKDYFKMGNDWPVLVVDFQQWALQKSKPGLLSAVTVHPVDAETLEGAAQV